MSHDQQPQPTQPVSLIDLEDRGYAFGLSARIVKDPDRVAEIKANKAAAAGKWEEFMKGSEAHVGHIAIQGDSTETPIQVTVNHPSN